jgi:hypothetical protein
MWQEVLEMFVRIRKQSACRKHVAQLQALLDARASLAESGNAAPPADADFRKHLEECRGCREALEAAELAGRLLREARAPEAGPGGFFAARVSAHIRAKEKARRAQADFWKPIETLSKRLVWTSALLLVVLTSVVYEMKPQRNPAPQAQESVTDRFPEPVPQTPDEDEVLVSLAERGR